MIEIISCSPRLNLQQPQVGRMFFLTRKQSHSWNVHTEELPDSRTASPSMLLVCQTAAPLILDSPHRSAVPCSLLRSLQEAENNAAQHSTHGNVQNRFFQCDSAVNIQNESTLQINKEQNSTLGKGKAKILWLCMAEWNRRQYLDERDQVSHHLADAESSIRSNSNIKTNATGKRPPERSCISKKKLTLEGFPISCQLFIEFSCRWKESFEFPTGLELPQTILLSV